MFGSITVLPPRTKRWAEAKVLADCVSVKVTVSLNIQTSYPYIFPRFTSCTSITTSAPWLWLISDDTSGGFLTSQMDGELTRIHTNIGVGSHDNTVFWQRYLNSDYAQASRCRPMRRRSFCPQHLPPCQRNHPQYRGGIRRMSSNTQDSTTMKRHYARGRGSDDSPPLPSKR